MKIVVVRGLALSLLVLALALAAVALATAREARPSWATHLGSALVCLFGATAVAGPVLSRSAALRWLCQAGWLLPATLVWIGVEHFVDWTAFHSSAGLWVIRTPREAQQVGTCFVLAGLGLLAGYTAIVLARHRRRECAGQSVARSALRSSLPILVSGT